MAKVLDGFPYVRSADGRGYECALCGAELPDGVSVMARNSVKGTLTGVLATDSDGGTVHDCGSKVTEADGGVNSTGLELDG